MCDHPALSGYTLNTITNVLKRCMVNKKEGHVVMEADIGVMQPEGMPTPN